MTVSTARRRVALVGNPNTGKTTLFNALTGLSQHVANYPGVTVERAWGRLGDGVELVDLPGAYSLAAKSPDELMAVRDLAGDLPDEARPDTVVVIVDASNLTRNLYLVTQVLELGVPTVLALNMIDVAERRGIHVDLDALARALRVPVVPITASRREGLDELRAAIDAAADAPPPVPCISWPEAIDSAVDDLAGRYETPRFLLLRALLDEGGASEQALLARHGAAFLDALGRARARAGSGGENRSLAAVEAVARYGWIREILGEVVRRVPARPTFGDRVDGLLTHRVLGLAIFVAVMTTVFLSIFRWAVPAMDAIDGAFTALGAGVASLLAGTALEGGILQSLVVDGILAGVGGVLVFLPQIVLLFLFIALLEDCGYMARAAFLMDRVLRFCGLSGHSFIPMLSSFACAIPGILSTRSIHNPRDRLLTILVAPLMTCSARLPVYTLFIAAFIPPLAVAGFLPLQGLVFAGLYFVGIGVGAGVAFALGRTIVRGTASPFVLELPAYKWPNARTVALRVWFAARAFVVRAGTIIFAMSILIWALGTFPRSDRVEEAFAERRQTAAATLEGPALEERMEQLAGAEAAAKLEASALGRLGAAIEPAVEPLGWDWRLGTAAVAAFPAREVIVSTLGILHGLGEEGDERTLSERLRAPADGGAPIGIPTALSVLVFVALCCQCASTLAVMARETRSWRWPAFAFAYMTGLAYVGALVTYQSARALGL